MKQLVSCKFIVSDASSTVTQTSQGPSAAEVKSKKVDYIVNPPDMFIKVEHLEPIPESEAMRKSLSFDEVPGPKALRHLARFWSFVPVVGTQVTASAIQYLLSAGKIFGNCPFFDSIKIGVKHQTLLYNNKLSL